MTKRNYEQEWRNEAYQKGMGSAKFSPPTGRNYRRAYHLTSAEHGISSISLRRLKVARFLDANDPFELTALNTHKREIRGLLKRFKVSKNSEMGLLCFSKNWTNPLLWSHYASKHEGICLGFDLTPGSEVQDVIYAKKRLRIKDEQKITHDFENQLLRTKFDGWKYEQEFRMFVVLSKIKHENGLYFLPFDKDLSLREVILGPKSHLSLESIRALVKSTNPGAVVFKTRLERRDFRIVGDGRYPPKVPTDMA